MTTIATPFCFLINNNAKKDYIHIYKTSKQIKMKNKKLELNQTNEL